MPGVGIGMPRVALRLVLDIDEARESIDVILSMGLIKVREKERDSEQKKELKGRA